MIFTLIVYGDPQSSQGPQTALRFARALVSRGHQIAGIFFYHEGAANGSALSAPPQDEVSLPRQWQALQAETGVDLVVCIGTALRRGILDAEEARRHGLSAGLLAGFRLGGLGELVEFSVRSDRIMTFAG